MRVLVCGGRNYANKEKVYSYLDNRLTDNMVIISGEALGADTLAKEWAKERNVTYEGFPAKWHLYGIGAGYKRNKQMLEEGKPDLVLAFPGGKGTANMVHLAIEAHVEVYLVGEDNEVS